MKSDKRVLRVLSMYSYTSYHGSSTVLAENTCVMSETFRGLCGEPMTPIHVHAFLDAAHSAKLVIGDFLEIEATHKKKPDKKKVVRCRVLAIKGDPKRTQLVTWKKQEASKAYFFQETGEKDYPLSDADFDQGLRPL